jgi:hypothetical protein
MVAAGRLPADLDVASVLWQPDRLEGGVRTVTHPVDIAERPPLTSIVGAAGQPSGHSATK